MTKRLTTGVSTKTARNVLALLQSIFSLAVDMDVIGRSPIRKSHKPKLVHREKPVWTADQVRAIVEAVPRSHRTVFVCAALTGARLGELLALQWKHVDLERRTLEIKQSLWNGQLLPPKTESSVRRVYFGEALKQALLEQQRTSNHRNPEAFVFSREDGSPLSGDLLRRDVLYPALDRLQIPRGSRCAGFHTFRHSAASFINAETGNLKLAQRLLGHATLDMTANVYTHTAAEAERGAALALERAIYGDLFQTVPRIETWNKNEAVN
jgi:integrase